MDSAPSELPLSVSGRQWRLRESDADAVTKLAQLGGLTEFAASLLLARGVTEETLGDYLDTSIKSKMPDPFSVVDLEKGARRIADVVRAGGTVGIFGDYDVDGGTGTAILVRTLRQLGTEAVTHIPDRRTEGYGPSAQAFEKLLGKGAEIIVTVDCGTTSVDALAWAADRGADVVVVDHHLPTEALPPAHALINPQRADDSSGLENLSAAGVAFLLAVGVVKTLRDEGYIEAANLKQPDLLGLLDLAALGTVCDVVNLHGLNRAYVAQGLKVLGAGRNPGLAALSKVARVSGAPSTYHLGFVYGPRLNAGGRLGPANHALRLLTTDDEAEAMTIARELDALNADRRTVEQQVQSEALAQAEDQVERGARVVVVAGEGWHEGVIGIVAGRIKDRVRRPTFVLAINDDGIAKGSARSLKGVDIGTAVVRAAGDGLLIKGGGHEMAAGLSVVPSRIEEFRSFLESALGRDVEAALENHVSHIDASVGLAAIDVALANDLTKVGPFGAGNPEPMVICRNVQVSYSDRVGQDHVRAVLKDRGGAQLKGIAFRVADEALGAALMEGAGATFHMVGRIKEDSWNGRRQIQLQIEDAIRA